EGRNGVIVEPLVEMAGLCRWHRVGAAEVRAVDGVDLTIARGEFLAVGGVSGSGQSTPLPLLGGPGTPAPGRIPGARPALGTLTAYERALYRRRTVGFVFQAFHLVPSMTASGNVALALTLQGTYGADRRQLTAEALERVGLANRAGHRPGQLSGGEQQRVAL